MRRTGYPPAGPEMQGLCAVPEDRPEGAEEGNGASVPNCKGQLWQNLGAHLVLEQHGLGAPPTCAGEDP